jgi:hypothetical protein
MWVLVPMLLAACSSLPIIGQSNDEKKAECDRIAAQAIQTDDLSDATRLAAAAADCYAAAQR